METDQGSTVPRRQLGRYLRQLREDAQITIKRAAEELEWSAPKIWRIEGGATSMRALDVEAMCRVYGASPDQTKILMDLARETKSKGWWEVQRRIALRHDRQKIPRRTWPPTPQLDVVLNEAVLHRPMRSRVAMAEQLRHIIRVTALPNVSVQVLPYAAGIHHASMACGSFGILDFPDNGLRAEPSRPPSTATASPARCTLTNRVKCRPSKPRGRPSWPGRSARRSIKVQDRHHDSDKSVLSEMVPGREGV